MRDFRPWLRLPLIVLMLAFGTTVAGCEEEGPAEKAGKAVDDAATTVEQKVDDAADEMKDEVQKNE